MIAVAGLLLAGAVVEASADDFSITNISIGPDGKPRVQNPADTNYYYILYRGQLTNIVLASDLALATNGTVQLTGPATTTVEPRAFFRVRRVPVSQPLDTDGDGIDDVYELMHPGILSPLVAGDALADPDGDGFTNLKEYQWGSDPGVSNGPAILVNSPASIVAPEGSSQQLQVFRDQDGGRFEVTARPFTTFTSSAPAIVSVDSSGLLQFLGRGTADVVTALSGLSATTHIVVDATALPTVQVSIGTAGGELGMGNGTHISIPPNALGASQMITLQQIPVPGGTIIPAGSALAGPMIDFGPSNLVFNADVTLTMPVTSTPPGYDPSSSLVHLLYENNRLGIEAITGPDGDEDLVETANQSYDPDTQRVTTAVRHFSSRTVVARAMPTPIVLTAPDGTTLNAFQLLKTEKPSKGPDGYYGVPHCDDNHDGTPDDVGEFELHGAGCVGTVDDVAVPIPTRTEASISYIVLHSTAGKKNSSFSGETTWAASRRNLAWAHYYVGKDGTIVQISQDTDVANHVRNGNGIGNANAIGIEIFNNVDGQNYPGRQLSAVVRLCDFLMHAHSGIVRPSQTNPDGNITTHAEQDATPGRKSDPTGKFRTAVMGSPSLEEIVRRALYVQGRTNAIVNAHGGDALGSQTAGNGGEVRLEAAIDALSNDYDDHRTSIQVASGATAVFSGSANRMHVLVNGTLRFNAASALDLDGILYVGPQGTLDARGTPLDGTAGFNLDFTADGFALIEGRVLVNGADKLAASELAPFNQPPFPPAGSGNGDGGNAGHFIFRSAAPGPVWVPTIITRGGDGDAADATFYKAGGAGGDVHISAALNGNNDPVLVQFEGRNNDPAADLAEVGLPDFMPPPPPFNLMPVTTATPLASPTCHATSDAPPYYLRPLTSERLALGHAINSVTRAVGQDVSRFHRGIVTSGGMGGAESSTSTNSAGGHGGNISISNGSTGPIKFVNSVQLMTGAGPERLASVIFVAGGGCADFKYFEIANGCAGGRGALNSGNGGAGGAAGNITIAGIIYPNASPTTPSGSSTPILGYNGDNPNISVGITIGTVLTFGTEGFSTSSCKGSGGSPGGSSSSFPGFFGPAGANGTTTINGTIVFQ